MDTQQIEATIANGRSTWSEHLQHEIEQDLYNGAVGSTLVSETDRVRVWHLRLAPGNDGCQPLREMRDGRRLSAHGRRWGVLLR